MATASGTTSADRSSASARALAAATSTKARPSPLPTSHSATFPSSLQSPLPTPGFLQAERNKASMKTPLTPPPAYLDFLRNLDAKSLQSPLATSKSANFSFSDAQRSPYPWPNQPASARPNFNSQEGANIKLSDVSETAFMPNTPISPRPPAAIHSSKPHSRRASDGDGPSNLSKSRSTSLPTHAKPLQPIRRPSLIIPESPKSRSFSAMSPPSAHVSRARSPATANAARSYYTTLSADGSTPRALSAPALGTPRTRPYCVRHVITRTVTYTRPAGTTARIPGVTRGPEAPISMGSRSSSSGSGSEGRERTPKEDVMKLDTILNSTTDDLESGQKRKSNSNADAKVTDTPPEQYVEAGMSTKPLVGEVPSGKRRKVL